MPASSRSTLCFSAACLLALFVSGCARSPTVTPNAETDPVASSGDAADDPVVLVADPAHAWIVGTDKRWGLIAYDTAGQVQASIGRGRLNNVDAVPQAQGFLLAATNRSEKSIDLFSADPKQATLSFDGYIPVTIETRLG